jgi:hypothetical protein
VVAYEQLPVRAPAAPLRRPYVALPAPAPGGALPATVESDAAAGDAIGKVTVTPDHGLIEVRGATYLARFRGDVPGGLLALDTLSGVPVLARAEGATAALRHAFYRAPTDNDVGGLDTMLPNELLRFFVTKAQTSFNGLWLKAGLDQLQASVVERSAALCPVFGAPLQPLAGGAAPATGDAGQAREADALVCRMVEKHAAPDGAVRFTTETNLVFTARGVRVDVKVNAEPELLKIVLSLPRVGLELTLPGELDQLEYLGLGPHECYPDRKAAAWTDVHCTAVDDMHTNYVMPTECGGRADVQWLRARGARAALRLDYAFRGDVRPEFMDGDNLEAKEPAPAARPSGALGAQVSASRWSVAELAKAKHQYELPKRGKDATVHLHVDTAHMGLGGDVSWHPRVHEQYRVLADEWRYAINLAVD